MKKVYCNNCKYIRANDMGYRWCGKVLKKYDTPYKKDCFVDIVDDYKEQNKDYNCEFYTKKWWKFWVK